MATRGFREQVSARVFYTSRRGAPVTVTVTDTFFFAYGRRYRIDALTHLEWGVDATQVRRQLALRLVAVETLVVACIVMVTPSWIAAASAFGYLCFAATTIWCSVRRWPTPLALIADHDHEPVVLFTSSNHTEFHQVCRAVLRASELHRSRVTM